MQLSFDHGICLKDLDMFKVTFHGEPIPVIVLASLEDHEHMVKRPVALMSINYLQKPISTSQLVCASGDRTSQAPLGA